MKHYMHALWSLTRNGLWISSGVIFVMYGVYNISKDCNFE